MTDFGLGDCNEADVLDALRWHGLVYRAEPKPEGKPLRPLPMSWTGSERQRREQGTCSPPTRPPNTTPRFLIPVGTELSVCSVDDSAQHYRRHVTKQELRFERYEIYANGAYRFRQDGFFILVTAKKVKHRDRSKY